MFCRQCLSLIVRELLADNLPPLIESPCDGVTVGIVDTADTVNIVEVVSAVVASTISMFL